MPLDSGRQEARRVQTSGGALAPDAMARAGGLAGLRWCFEARSASRWMGCRRDAFSQIHLSPLALSSTILLHSQRHYRATLCTELTKPLIIGNIPSASLQPYEVRIRVHCCGVNFADILACQGLYQEKHPLPFTPGMEFSGDVMEAGKAVTRVKKGDRVIGVANTKALAEEYIADQKLLWTIPQGVSYESAAALPVSYGTAILALEHRAQTKPGETVLVTAAAGATGLAVIDVASHILKAKPGLGRQNCSGWVCWRNHPIHSSQSAPPEKHLCPGPVLGQVSGPGFPSLFFCTFFCSFILPSGTNPTSYRSCLQTGGGK
ncbi:quinone oxidoreductase-like protein 2 isoform X6 [Pogona vitticeps]